MKDKEVFSTKSNSKMDRQEEDSIMDEENKMKRSKKALWIVLVILIIGLISIIGANARMFNFLGQSLSGCSSSKYPSSDALQYGSGAYRSSCHPQTSEQYGEELWQNALQASPVVIAMTSVIATASLVILTWQIAKLVKILDRKR